MALNASSLISRRGASFVRLSDGLLLAYQEWLPSHSVANGKQIVGVHGWLDNSNSFAFLGPKLASSGYRVVAVDLVGHGLSDHLGIGASYNISKTMASFSDFIYGIGLNNFHLIGHSMGASVSIMLAATMHEFVERLVLIEGFGPVIASEEETSRNLRNAIDSERRMNNKNVAPKPYPTLGSAIDARIKSVSSYPGSQHLSREAAKLLIARGTELVEDTSSHYKDLDDEQLGPVTFRHDKRLVLPSHLYHSNQQVMSYVNSIIAPTLLISAKHGWPIPEQVFRERKEAMMNKGILTHVHLEGSHHLHLDPSDREPVAEHILRFLR